MLKIQRCITEISYILKYIKIEKLFYIIINATLVSIKDVLQKCLKNLTDPRFINGTVCKIVNVSFTWMGNCSVCSISSTFDLNTSGLSLPLEIPI